MLSTAFNKKLRKTDSATKNIKSRQDVMKTSIYYKPRTNSALNVSISSHKRVISKERDS